MATEKCLKDANALIAEFEWLQSQVSSTTALEIQEHIQRIKDAPTVDAVEVVHGRWISPTKINGRSFNIFHCSVCNGVPPGVNEHTKYCSHCGAKMDGDMNG